MRHNVAHRVFVADARGMPSGGSFSAAHEGPVSHCGRAVAACRGAGLEMAGLAVRPLGVDSAIG